jgi:hypothetical protein
MDLLDGVRNWWGLGVGLATGLAWLIRLEFTVIQLKERVAKQEGMIEQMDGNADKFQLQLVDRLARIETKLDRLQ